MGTLTKTFTLDEYAHYSFAAIGQQLAVAGYGLDRHYKLAGVADGPRAFSFYLDPHPVIQQDFIKAISALVSRFLGVAVRRSVRTDEPVPVRLDLEGPRGTLALEVGKPETLWLTPTVDWDGLDHDRGLSVPVGLTADRKVVRLDFADAVTPAALVAGMPGSGKSNAVVNVVRALSKQNPVDDLAFLFVDASPKQGVDFAPLATLASRLADPVTDPDVAVAVLRWAVARLDGSDPRRVFVIVEEATDLVAQRDEAAGLLSTLGRGGRAAGIHLVSVFHNPTVENTSKRDAAAMIPARLVGRVADAVAASVATGRQRTGAEMLTGKGDMLYLSPSQNLVRVTVPLLRERDLDGLPRRATVEPLDLEPFAVPGREVVPPQQRPDPLDLHVVGKLVDKLARCQRTGDGMPAASTLGHRLDPQMRKDKMGRHIDAAREVLEGIKSGSKEFDYR